MLSARGYSSLALAVFLGLMVCKTVGDRALEMSCWSGGYAQDAWMAYCNSQRYGVYDIEAVWHRVEPDVERSIRAAQVLTLSDSRLQNALSLGGASEWFSAHRYPVYMLGLPTEASGFGARLLDNFHPHPSVVIFDASPYFTGEMGKSEQPIFADASASRRQVTALKEFQSTHRQFCAGWQWACGHTFSYFRSRLDGHWIFPSASNAIWIGNASVPSDRRHYPTASKVNERLPMYPRYLAEARRLVEKLGIAPGCVVVTNVPADEDLRGLARYIGTNLGLTTIDPQLPDIATFDHAHLTPRSAQAWTGAFLHDLEPVLHRCIPAVMAGAGG